jgi:hypothetical protein
MFYLSVNYRSHAGIVNCAHTIVEIITQYWRNSIDSLPRERGNAHGAMTIFYTDMYPEYVRKVSGNIKHGAYLNNAVYVGPFSHPCSYPVSSTNLTVSAPHSHVFSISSGMKKSRMDRNNVLLYHRASSFAYKPCCRYNRTRQ